MIKTFIRIQAISCLTIEFVTILALNGCAATTHPISVSAVVSHPTSYSTRVLTVIGVATGDGPEIEVFDNVTEAQRLDPRKSLFVRSKNPGSVQARYDMRRVQVTGRIDAEDHGVWGNPCAMHSAIIEVLSGRLAVSKHPGGVFRNESQRRVTVSIVGQISTRFELDPGGAETRPLSHVSEIEIRSQDEVLLARKRIVQNAKTPFYDTEAAVLYYRFANGRVERVLPEVGRKWPLKSI